MEVYSFQDATLTLSQDGFADLSTAGQGIGEIVISYAADSFNDAGNIASDGVVVFSKIKQDNGTLSITCQQTSSLHKNLVKRFNALYYSEDTSIWASMNGIFKNKSTGEQKILKGVAFHKIPDNSNQRTVQNVTWEFDVANLSTNII